MKHKTRHIHIPGPTVNKGNMHLVNQRHLLFPALAPCSHRLTSAYPNSTTHHPPHPCISCQQGKWRGFEIFIVQFDIARYSRHDMMPAAMIFCWRFRPRIDIREVGKGIGKSSHPFIQPIPLKCVTHPEIPDIPYIAVSIPRGFVPFDICSGRSIPDIDLRANSVVGAKEALFQKHDRTLLCHSLITVSLV